MTISGIGQGMSMSMLYGMQNTQKPSASDIVNNIFQKLDTNGDGVLSADEISKAGNQAQNILGADANGDRVVTKDELSAEITKKMASHRAHHIMSKLDTNGDGSLSTDEINNGGTAAQSILPADTNGDGVVSMTELIAYLTNNSAANLASSSETPSQLNSLV
ncbi:MAG: EF-hand domain-containing protein [Sedimentisphaerales bacterium]|jgi:Ca2+-binding EF-hand superfamily protein